jgi:hypothetical protein
MIIYKECVGSYVCSDKTWKHMWNLNSKRVDFLIQYMQQKPKLKLTFVYVCGGGGTFVDV